MSQIEQGLQADGVDEIRAAAHALKSASANVGALCLSSACGNLESAAGPSAAHDLDELTELVAAAVKLYDDVRSALSGAASDNG